MTLSEQAWAQTVLNLQRKVWGPADTEIRNQVGAKVVRQAEAEVRDRVFSWVDGQGRDHVADQAKEVL